MTRAIAAVAVALLLAPSALAAPDAPRAPAATDAPKPSPAAERVARALTTQPNWNETISSYASSLSSQISAALKSQGSEAPMDVEKRVRAGLDGAVGYDEVVRLQAQALAGRFGEDELRVIQRFYESAAGKKLVSELPAVSRQVIEVVQQRISAAIPRIVEDVAPSLARAKPSAEEGTAREPGAPKDGPRDAQGRKPPPAQQPPRR
ncbi:MAG TPA: DUF2059 domain-containing protein [Anaeromyxobacter sp.]|nr:DUF2059 domain-containing protein [Anaeromyxobacter sp.]